MIISNVASALFYILTLFLFPQQLLVSSLDLQFFIYVFLIVMASWLPCYMVQELLRKLDPSDFEKIMANV